MDLYFFGIACNLALVIFNFLLPARRSFPSALLRMIFCINVWLVHIKSLCNISLGVRYLSADLKVTLHPFESSFPKFSCFAAFNRIEYLSVQSKSTQQIQVHIWTWRLKVYIEYEVCPEITWQFESFYWIMKSSFYSL